ncbi:MAG TPA: YihY/virulence factor BrkB family protein [Myxococcales bacterium]
MRRFIRAVTLVAHGFRGEAITLRAAALTYLTLLSLVPLLAVVYSVVDLFTGEMQIRDKLQSYVNAQLGIGAGAAISSALTTFTTRATIQALGIIGFLALLLATLWMLWNIEIAFNHIYGVRPPRGALQRLVKYWAFLTMGPVLLSASVYVTVAISRMNKAHGHAGHSELVHTFAALSSIAITYAGLAVLYKVVPNAKVRLRSALLAAFSAGTAWEIAKFLFAWSTARMVQLHKIYGSLAVLPVMLSWIYISWSIALVGCRLCYALDASLKPEAHPALRGAAAREAFTARLLVALVQLHKHAAGPLRPRALADELSATPRMVREGLLALSALGLASQTRKGGWLPSRDPSRVTLAEMRLAGRASLPYPPRDQDTLGIALARAFAQAEGAAQSALAETLESFLRRNAQPSEERVSEPLQVVQGVEKPA